MENKIEITYNLDWLTGEELTHRDAWMYAIDFESNIKWMLHKSYPEFKIDVIQDDDVYTYTVQVTCTDDDKNSIVQHVIDVIQNA